jgi:phosphoribosyl 1,2-cyclic phosphate phosphodiesterase
MKVTILGCGGSGGVPLIGCRCAVCTSPDPRNKRTRVSIVLESETGTRVLVDASPDLRQQFLANGVVQVDAVLLTHAHADHLHGIDDLRAVNFHRGEPLDIWGDATTIRDATTRFGYAFNPPRTNNGSWYAPSLRAREITGDRLQIGDLDIRLFEQIHGGDRHPTLGVRVGRFAYSTDVKELPETAFAALQGVEVWIVDCLQIDVNLAHSHLAQTLDWIARVKPQRAILTHMGHRMDYAALATILPEGVDPGVDGLVVDVID